MLSRLVRLSLLFHLHFQKKNEYTEVGVPGRYKQLGAAVEKKIKKMLPCMNVTRETS